MNRLKNILLVLALLLMALFVAPTSHAEPPTTVNVQGQGSFFLPAPCGCQVGVYLEVHAQGDPASLSGSGLNHATTGATNRWVVTGSTDGTAVTLSGTIEDSTAYYLIGSPVAVTANAATGEITFTLGPITGGPFHGMTFAIPSSGTVVINNP